MNNLIKYFVILTAALYFTGSCSSAPAIDDKLTAPELVQKAQEASDHNRYKTAVYYYEAILEKFPHDLAYTCEAEYEIAFIKYKQKKYSDAKTGFNALLRRYESPDMELLPQHFKILSVNVLEKIEAALKKTN